MNARKPNKDVPFFVKDETERKDERQNSDRLIQ